VTLAKYEYGTVAELRPARKCNLLLGPAVRSIHWPGGTGLPVVVPRPFRSSAAFNRPVGGPASSPSQPTSMRFARKAPSEPSQANLAEMEQCLLEREDCTLVAWYRFF
jgi:hypothetical protein